MAVVLLTDNNLYSIDQQALTGALVFIVLGITMLILLAANIVQKRIGENGIILISKVKGLIIAANAVQSILSGLRDFFLL